MQSGQQTPAQSGWRRPQADQHHGIGSGHPVASADDPARTHIQPQIQIPPPPPPPPQSFETMMQQQMQLRVAELQQLQAMVTQMQASQRVPQHIIHDQQMQLAAQCQQLLATMAQMQALQACLHAAPASPPHAAPARAHSAASRSDRGAELGAGDERDEVNPVDYGHGYPDLNDVSGGSKTAVLDTLSMAEPSVKSFTVLRPELFKPTSTGMDLLEGIKQYHDPGCTVHSHEQLVTAGELSDDLVEHAAPPLDILLKRPLRRRRRPAPDVHRTTSASARSCARMQTSLRARDASAKRRHDRGPSADALAYSGVRWRAQRDARTATRGCSE